MRDAECHRVAHSAAMEILLQAKSALQDTEAKVWSSSGLVSVLRAA